MSEAIAPGPFEGLEDFLYSLKPPIFVEGAKTRLGVQSTKKRKSHRLSG
jgi:hypothetical protein